jgi:large subunit ribosomal protein L15
MAILSKLGPPAGSKKTKRRVGRGRGSGKGRRCGRGQKGQNSRSGSGGRLYFEGGQMPLQRRVPKRGFRNPTRAQVANVDVAALEAFPEGSEVTVAALRERGLVKGRVDRVKVLGSGQLTRKLTVVAHAFSQGAAAKIEQAGGKAVVCTPPAPGEGKQPSG